VISRNPGNVVAVDVNGNNVTIALFRDSVLSMFIRLNHV
jgi:hypothetical protein